MTTAILVAILVAIFTAIFLPMTMWGEHLRTAEEKARARRLAEAKMNARLLRLNI